MKIRMIFGHHPVPQDDKDISEHFSYFPSYQLGWPDMAACHRDDARICRLGQDDERMESG